jgi:hypothetical protein
MMEGPLVPVAIRAARRTVLPPTVHRSTQLGDRRRNVRSSMSVHYE